MTREPVTLTPRFYSFWPLILLGVTCALSSCNRSAQDGKAAVPTREHALEIRRNAAAFYDKGDYTSALELYRKAAPFFESSPQEYAADLNTVYFRIGDSLLHLRRPAEAIEGFQKAVSIAETYLPADSNELLRGLVALGRLEAEAGRNEQAITHLTRAHEALIAKKLEEEPIQLYLDCTELLADANRALGQAEPALKHLLEHATACEKFLGAAEERIGLAQVKAAEWLLEANRVDGSRAWRHKSIESLRTSLGKDRPAVADQLMEIARLDLDIFLDGESAARDYAEALRIYKQEKATNAKLYAALDGLGTAAFQLGTVPDYRAVYKEALKRASALFAADSPQTCKAKAQLAACLASLGEKTEARALVERLVGLRGDNEKMRSVEYLEAFDFAALALLALDEVPQAELILTENLSLAQSALGNTHPQFTQTALRVVKLYLEYGAGATARRYLEHLYQTSSRTFGETHPRTALIAYHLGLALDGASKFEEAEKFFRTALETISKHKGPSASLALAARHRLGIVLATLARYDEATSLLEENLKFQGELLGDTHEDFLATEAHLARVLYLQGDFEKARARCLEAVQRAEDTGDPGGLGRAELLDILSRTLLSLQDVENASTRAEESLRLRLAHLHSKHSDVVRSRITLGGVYAMTTNPGKAELELILARDLAITIHGEISLPLVEITARLAGLYHRTGHYAEADKNFRASLEKAAGVYPEAHPEVIRAHENFARFLFDRDLHEESAAEYRLALELSNQRYGPGSAETLRLKTHLANTLANGVDRDGALRIASEVRVDFPEIKDTATPAAVLQVLLGLARASIGAGELDGAARDIEEATDFAEAHPELHRRLVGGMAELVSALEKKKQFPEAEKFARQAVRFAEEKSPAVSLSRIQANETLGTLLHRRARYQDAQQVLGEALEDARGYYGDQSAAVLNLHDYLADTHVKLGNPLEAEKELTECYVLSRTIFGEDSETFDRYRYELAGLHATAGRRGEALRLYEASLAFRKKHFGAHIETIRAVSKVAQIYGGLSEYPKAAHHTLDAIAMFGVLGGDDSASVAYLYDSLGVIYFGMANRTLALQYWEQALNRFHHLDISNETVERLEANVEILRAEHKK